MEIQHDIKEGQGRFTGFIEQEMAAQISYSTREDGVLIIEHTDVNPKFKGKGLGREIVIDGLVSYARLHQKKLLPHCTFVLSVFEKYPQIGDVLF